MHRLYPNDAQISTNLKSNAVLTGLEQINIVSIIYVAYHVFAISTLPNDEMAAFLQSKNAPPETYHYQDIAGD